MNGDTYGGWILAWGVAILPLSTLGCLALHSPLGIIMGTKFCVLMMLLGRCFWKRNAKRAEQGEAL